MFPVAALERLNRVVAVDEKRKKALWHAKNESQSSSRERMKSKYLGFLKVMKGNIDWIKQGISSF